MSIAAIQAIDIHGHFGRYASARADIGDDFMSGDAATVVARARRANIALMIVSPLEALLPRGKGNATEGNRNAARIVAETPGLLQYVVIDPRWPETFRQAEEMPALPTCVGIKIHPEEHVYPIREFGGPIFEFAARDRAVVLSHSSEANSLAADLVEWADRFPEARLILAHIGNGTDGDYTQQVRGVQRSRHGNVYADTSSARSIAPNLIEWAVREIGAEHVLFGTDTPLYHASMQRIRIDHAELTDLQRRLILRDNAVQLFGLASDAPERNDAE